MTHSRSGSNSRRRWTKQRDHVGLHQPGDVPDVVARQFQAAQHLRCQRRAQLVVAVKVNAARVGVHGVGAGFAHIMEQGGPAQGQRRVRQAGQQLVQRLQSMFKHVQMVETALLETPPLAQFGKGQGEQAQVFKAFQTVGGVGVQEQGVHLVADAFSGGRLQGAVCQLRRHRTHLPFRPGLQPKAKRDLQPPRPPRPQRIGPQVGRTHHP
jgi:hypothetical protein